MISIEFRMTRFSCTWLKLCSKSNLFFSSFADFSWIFEFLSFSIDWGRRKTTEFWKFSSKIRFNDSASSLSRLSPSYSSTMRLTFSLLASFSIFVAISLNFRPSSLPCVFMLGTVSISFSSALLGSWQIKCTSSLFLLVLKSSNNICNFLRATTDLPLPYGPWTIIWLFPE